MSVWASLSDRCRSSFPFLWRSARYYATGLYRELLGKNVSLWAQAIAFKVLVTIVPILLLTTGLIGQMLRQEQAFAAVARFIRELLPGPHSQQLIDFLTQLQGASATILGIGGLGLFLSVLSLFITLRIAVANAFRREWHERRSLLRGYLFDVRMVVQVGGLFLLTIGLSVSLPSLVGDVLTAQVVGDGQWIMWVQWLWGRALWATGLLLPLLLTTAMFFHLYYFIPRPSPRKRTALAGALVAAILWESAKQLFAFYATYVGFGTGTEALGSTFKLIIAFVLWVYLSGVVLIIGAIVASLRQHRRIAITERPEIDAALTPAVASGDIPKNANGKPEVENPPDSSPTPLNA
jgi:membrane protein